MLPGLTSIAGRAGGGWSPANITTAAWWDFTDTTTLWQDTAGTTAVASASDPIGRVDDKSGNGRNLLQASATLRPLYQTSDFTRANWDGSDDELEASFSTTGMSDMSLWFAIRVTRNGANILPFWGSAYAGAMISGSSSPPHASVGSPTYYVGGSLVTPTQRGALFNALYNQTVVLEIRNLDWDATAGMTIGNYGSGYIIGGDIAEILFMQQSEADSNRASIAAYLADKLGI